MRRGLARSAMVVAASAAAVAAFAAPAGAQEPDVAVHLLDGAASETTEHWTADRMRAAIPMDDLLDRTVPAAGDVARGAPTVIRPQAANSTGDPWTGGGEVTETAGRVFFDFNGSPASCSGNAVTSANRSVVLTAGHCVKYEGSWHTNWIFVPGYDNGNAPFGEWTASRTLTTPQWEASEDIDYDVGAAVVEPLGGNHLTDVVGAQGVAFNTERGQDMYAFGYPAADPYDGESLTYCSGATFTDPFFSEDYGLRCDMTGGSSGGPWFLGFDEATGLGVQASVNSFGYTFLPGYMFGPYFGSDAQALYDTAQVA
ncbi:trypsin-like serine peptidase [Prauserella flavalba]|uniref:Peptidase n=1 Tax=Prauserella flavalba TaxID=1477506 RepID=A0A318LHK5_9PSEU|nr:peptidase [Prauserella flavalba]PXY28895.1 peptidase [Prauserella flavalba]